MLSLGRSPTPGGLGQGVSIRLFNTVGEPARRMVNVDLDANPVPQGNIRSFKEHHCLPAAEPIMLARLAFAAEPNDVRHCRIFEYPRRNFVG